MSRRWTEGRRACLAVGALAVSLGAPPARSQDRDTVPDSAASGRRALPAFVAATSAYYATSLLVLGRTWYKDRPTVPFHFYDDTRAYLQVDKAGHAFGAYVYSYAAYHALLKAGFSRRDALLFGATAGAVLQAPVEIMDGFHEGYGFSWGDIAANTMGSAVVLGQELLFREQAAKLKFSYRESRDARRANGYLGTGTFDRLLSDYNGHTYWVSVPLGGLVRAPAPRWLNLAVGYGADGMYGEFENITSYGGVAIPPANRERQLLLSLDVDWTRITTGSRFVNAVLTGMTTVKLPFPALEYSGGRVRAHWLYY